MTRDPRELQAQLAAHIDEALQQHVGRTNITPANLEGLRLIIEKVGQDWSTTHGVCDHFGLLQYLFKVQQDADVLDNGDVYLNDELVGWVDPDSVSWNPSIELVEGEAGALTYSPLSYRFTPRFEVTMIASKLQED